MKKTVAQKGNPELIEALNAIEKEKDISKEILLEAIENSLLAACKNQFGKSDNIRVNLDRESSMYSRTKRSWRKWRTRCCSLR